MKPLFSIFFSLIISQAFSQFTEVSSQYNFSLLGSSTQSGCGVSTYDYDHDGWDDLTIGQTSNEIIVYHNDGGDYHVAFTFPNTGDPKQLCWIDYDNDGDSDFFFTVSTQSAKLFRNDGGLVFTDVTANLNLPLSNGKSFGACWGDYDRDGFADVYICNYNTLPNSYTNWLLHNNGDGTFSDVTAAMAVGNGFKPSYQSSWIDVNQDGWLDLYIANDFSYGNELYLNNGFTFDAAGSLYGLDIDMEGMSNAWSDFDSDGDWDLFVADNLPGNKLMRNDDFSFVDIAAGAGVQINSTCWGSLWLDYDNDGNDDLHVATSNVAINGNKNFLFHNNGDYTFTDASITGDNKVTFATAKGDKNNDGYWDIFEMKQYPTAVSLLQNNGGTNHWLKVGLTGTVSNTDAIGTVIKYFVAGQEFMRHTFCGESFLGQDSQYEILSLADADHIDSLVIYWPRGWVDRHYNLAADQKYSFIEGETFTASISSELGNAICPSGGSLMLTASEGSAFLWSNDSTAQQTEVTAPGVYSVQVSNESGITATAFFEVLQLDLPQINADVSNPSCYSFSDGCITLSSASTVIDIANVTWSDNSEGISHCSLPSGNYSALITDSNGCEQSANYVLTQPDSLVVVFTADTACFNATSSALTQVTGGDGNYSFDFNGSVPGALTPDIHFLEVHDGQNCTASASCEVFEYDEIVFSYTPDTVCFGQTTTLIYDVTGVQSEYTINWFGADPEFISAGEYNITITNLNECTANASFEILESPEMSLTTNIQNAAGGNNGSVQLTLDGGIPPYEFNWNNDTFEQDLQNVGQGTYNVIVTDAAGCTAAAEVDVIDTYVNEYNLINALYPNPFLNEIHIALNQPMMVTVEDAFGRFIYKSSTLQSNFTINAADWKSGIYFIRVGGQCMKMVKCG